MTSYTTAAIRNLSNDAERANGLIALMNYYGKSNLRYISEEQALTFLSKVENGEIRICDYLDKV